MTTPSNSLDMEGDQLDQNTLDIMADIEVDDLPEDITVLADSFQEFYTDAERLKTEALITMHEANLSAINSKIKCLDEQIACLESHRQKLFSRRDQVSKNLDVLKSILSPIRRVPTDVLGEIFIHCLPKTPVAASMIALSMHDAPLLVCQVCSKWRRTAISSPRLWKALAFRSKYSFNLTAVTTTVCSSISPMLETWFARAGSCLLSLGINLLREERDAGFNLQLHDVLNQLPNSRLQHLYLKTPYASDSYFLSNISMEFTELESIFLETLLGSDHAPAPQCLLQSSPRLRSAQLHNFIDSASSPISLIPWSQLTHLRIERQLSAGMWYKLICHCVNLQVGIFSINQLDAEPSLPTAGFNVILPHLVQLTVSITEYGQQPTFHRLSFPSLQRLQFLFYSCHFFHVWNIDLPVNDTCSLDNIVIIGKVNFEEPQLYSLLNYSSSVTDLRFSVETDYNKVFTTFTSSSTTQQLLPKLETLHCNIQDIGDDIDYVLQPLAAFIQSRLDVPQAGTTCTSARLRRLTLKFQDFLVELEEDLMNQVGQVLAPFRDQGLSLELDTWSNDSLHWREIMRCELE